MPRYSEVGQSSAGILVVKGGCWDSSLNVISGVSLRLIQPDRGISSSICLAKGITLKKFPSGDWVVYGKGLTPEFRTLIQKFVQENNGLPHINMEGR